MIFYSWFPLVMIFFAFTLAKAEVGYDASADKCLNHADDGKYELLKSFETNNDPLKQAYIKNQDKDLIFDKPWRHICDKNLAHKKFLEFKNTMQELSKTAYNPPAQIKLECIEAAMNRNVGNDGYTCHFPTAKEIESGFNPKTQSVPKKYGQAGGKTAQCLNKELARYMNYAVNAAIQCLSPTIPIDSRLIYQKINNETGFNPSIAYTGGVSVTQVTTYAVKELNSKLGNATYILKNVANSTNKACTAFKEIAKKDLKQRPRINKNNYCHWVSTGDGLARGLLYGIGYYVGMRDRYVVPALKKRAPHLIKNQDLLSKLTAISYGREGIKHSRWLLKKFRVNNKTDAATLLKQVDSNSIYLKEMRNKTKESACLQKGYQVPSPQCKNLKLTEEELRGDTCVIK